MSSFSGTYNLSSLNTTQQLHVEASPALLIFKATAICAITVLNISANTSTLVVLRKFQGISPVTKVFMTSMTISDLGAAFVLAPIVAATVVNRWPFGKAFCSILGFFFALFAYTSILSLFSVTSERYLAVTRPFQYPTLMTIPRARIISLCVWLCGLTGAASSGFMPGRVIYYSQSWHACVTGPKDPSVADTQKVVSVILLATVPFGLNLLMFLRLFLLAKFHAAKIAAQERPIIGHVGRKSDKKVFTTFFITTIFLTMGWTPLMALVIYESITQTEVSLWLVCLAELAAFSNTVTNVMVYYLRNRAFRQAAKAIIAARMPCCNMKIETPVIPLVSLI